MDDKKDKQLIILSIIVAIFMWAFVMTTTNPSLTKTIRNVPLTIRNLEILQNRGFELVGKENLESITVKVQASRNDMLALDNEDLIASVDLQSPTEGIRSLNISVDTPSGVKVVETEPKKINLKIEKVIEKEFSPKLDIPQRLREDRIIEVNEMYPNKVSVEAIRSQIEKIKEIRVKVDKEEYLNGKIHNVDLEALDKNAKKIEHVNLSVNQLSLSFKVSETKEVPIKLVTEGEVDKDYEIKFSKITPEKIILKADQGILDKIEELETETLNISGIKANKEGRIKIKLPENVEIYDGDKQVAYSITLKRLEKNKE